MKPRALVAELIGTFTLCFVGVLSIVHLGGLPGQGGLLGIALAFGLIVAGMSTAFGGASGGHFNPAVTLCLFAAKKLPLRDLVPYIAAQVLGAILAGLAVRAVNTDPTIDPALIGTTKLAMGLSFGVGFGVEILATFLFMLIILGCAVDPRTSKQGALCIGLGLSALIIATGPLTGAALNPARYLGPALVSGSLKDVLLYTAGPLLGAALAGALGPWLFSTMGDPDSATEGS